MASPCPGAAELQKLFDGCLSEKEADQVGAHVDECSTCQDLLGRMTSEVGNLAACARTGRTKTMTVEPALLEAMDALKDGHLATAEFPEDDNEDFTENVLRPSDQPGILGLLGSYEIVETIGTGGMGRVYKAKDPALNRFVAIKIIAPQLSTSKGARKRFAREARAAAAISHENVVQIYSVPELNEIPYLVMEYVPGISLQQKIDRREPIELKDILRIGQQTAAGLAAAHAQGLIHRDIKPPNILLERGEERVKITDFGLARMVDDASLTQSGVLAGTPQYMAPEQARGEAQDHRVDLFSLGSVLYTLCTGSPPFRANTTMAVLRQVSDQDPQPIRNQNPKIPTWLCAIIARLHEKDPADRFQSAKVVADLLGQCLAHVQDPARFPMPEWRDKRSILSRRILQPTSRAAVLGFLVALVCAVGFWQAWQAFNTPRVSKEMAGVESNGMPADVGQPMENQIPPSPEIFAASINEKDKKQVTLDVVRELLKQKNAKEQELLSIKRELERIHMQAASPTVALPNMERFPTSVTVRNSSTVRSAIQHGLAFPKTIDARALAISPDGVHLAIADGNNQIRTFVFIRSPNSEYWFSTLPADPVQMRVRDLKKRYQDVRKSIPKNAESERWEKALASTLQDYLDRAPKVIEQRARLERLRAEVDALATTEDAKVLGARSRLKRDLETAGKELDQVQESMRTQLRQGVMRNAKMQFSDELEVDLEKLHAIEGLIQSVTIEAQQQSNGAANFFVTSANLNGEIREERRFPVDCKSITSLCYASDGEFLVGSGKDGTDLFVWDARTGRELHRIKGHEAPLLKVEVCADTQQVVSCSTDGCVRVWAPGENKSSSLSKKNLKSGICDLVVSASGDWITILTKEGEVQGWQTGEGGELTRAWKAPAPVGCRSLSVTPDQKYGAFLTANKTVEIFNGETGKKIRTVGSAESEWTCLAFLPQSQALVIGSKNGKVSYYDVPSWQKRGHVKLESSPVAISVCPNARVIGIRQANGTASLAPLTVQTSSVSLPAYSSVEVGTLYPNQLKLMPERLHQ